MRLITNEKLIKRNATIGKIANPLGMAVTLGGLYLLLRQPEMATLLFGVLILALLLSNVGIYFSNRWVRQPRPDQSLDAALKGLDNRYSLYHYRLGASHALVSPAGVFALVPKYQVGEITYDKAKARWRQKGGNWYLKIFGQEGLGNPSADAASETSALARKLKKLLPDRDLPPIQAIVVFTSDRARVNAPNAPLPALYAKKLKNYIRNQPRGATLSKTDLRAIDEKLGVL